MCHPDVRVLSFHIHSLYIVHSQQQHLRCSSRLFIDMFDIYMVTDAFCGASPFLSQSMF